MNYTVISKLKLIQVHEGFYSLAEIVKIGKMFKGYQIGFGQIFGDEGEEEEKPSNTVGFRQNIVRGADYVDMNPYEEDDDGGY